MRKIFFVFFLILIVLPITAFAQDNNVCNGLVDPALTRCQTCMGPAGAPTGMVWTALGCLNAGTPVGVQGSLIGQILVWSTVVGGGIAFVIIAFAGIQIATAAGDPKKMKSAQELIWSAVSGLLLIVFSILILNLVGFRILNIGTGLVPQGGTGLPAARP